MSVVTPSKSLDHLVGQALSVECTMGDDELSQVADLTLRIAQAKARSKAGVLTPQLARTYTERPEVERAGMRSMVQDVVTALVLLGIIDRPG